MRNWLNLPFLLSISDSIFMMLFFYVWLLIQIYPCLGHAVPHLLNRRNICDINDSNFEPVLYKEYREADCPPILKIDADGHCPMNLKSSSEDRCTTFCQIRTNYIYDQEQPVLNSYCHGPFSCTITNSETFQRNYGGSINGKFLEAVGFGISGSFTQTTSTITSRATQVKLEQSQCGYFTIIPIVKSVCGTMTDWGTCLFIANPTPMDIANFCASSPKAKAGQDIDSDTIFVRTDCITRVPLDLTQQDPLIQAHPEVLLDRGTISGFLNNLISSVPPNAAGTAADPNGGQGGSNNSDSFSLVFSNSTFHGSATAMY